MGGNGSRVISDAYGEYVICGAMVKDPPRGWQHLVCGLEPGHDGDEHVAFDTGGRQRGTRLAAWTVGT